MSAEAQAELEASYLPHERAARTQGIPALGAGVIYPVSEEEIKIAPFAIPKFYRHAYALDVGWNRTAALWGALDTETDVLYIYSEHYRADAEPAIHAQAIKSRGAWIPGVIDPASRGRNQTDGQSLLTMYRTLGLQLTEANNAVEAGIYEMWSRLSTGRMKVFSTCTNFFGEYRIYRRDEKGKVVKTNDHLMDAGRYLSVSGVSIAAFRPADQWRQAIPQVGAKREKEWTPLGALDADRYGMAVR